LKVVLELAMELLETVHRGTDGDGVDDSGP
jgi:hypothetical protein